MCIFSQQVTHVSGTRIFARGAGSQQVLVYAMDFTAAGDLAMVLPLPTPPGPAEDAVRFVDLSGYPSFFTDVHKAFPPRWVSGAVPAAAAQSHLLNLEVHTVGAFEASFVPSRDDFHRLDDRFRLSPAVWDALPEVADWSFAVFKLRGGGENQKVHPMALWFPRRDSSRVYFPTVHVHDGAVHAEAVFDHQLYCQSPTRLRRPSCSPRRIRACPRTWARSRIGRAAIGRWLTTYTGTRRRTW